MNAFICKKCWIASFGVPLIVILSMVSCSSMIHDKIGAAVTIYCAAPIERRTIYRAAVNVATQPNAVTITCAGD